MKKISVAIATYNGEKFINEQIVSITNQTLKPDEIIVCDDNSTDGTVEILRNLINFYKDLNIKLVINEKNVGYTKNFANAMKMCTGDVIFLSDQDDIWAHNKIEDYLKALENENIVLLAGGKEYVDENFHLKDINKKPVFNINKIKKISFESALTRAMFNGCVLAIDKTKIDEKLFNKLVDYLYDNILDTHDKFLVYYFAGIDKYYLLDEVYTYYRLHNDNLAGSNRSLKPRGDYNRRVLQANCDVNYLSFFKEKVESGELLINKSYNAILEEILNYKFDRLNMLKNKSILSFFKLLDKKKWNDNKKVVLGDFYYILKK